VFCFLRHQCTSGNCRVPSAGTTDSPCGIGRRKSWVPLEGREDIKIGAIAPIGGSR
jgi:hypothetical protein